jgi:peptide/nickel transport system substrate-binding protein
MMNPLDLSSTDPITRRRMLSGSAVGAALLLAGCSSAAKSGSSGGGSSSGSGSGATQSLTLGTVTDLAPTTFLRAGTNTAVLSLVFDTLALLDPQTLKPAPSVATSWDWNADRTELTVNLRSDVRYHSGRALTPKDVIFSVKAEQDPTAGAQVGGIAAHIKSMVQSGPHQVKFVLEKPISSFTDLLVMTPLVDSETYKQLASAKKVIGTGPFVFENWTPGTSIALRKNPHYWQSGAPKLDTVKVRIFSSEQALVSALRDNQIDLAWNLVPSDAALLAKGNQFPSASTAPLFSEWYVGANVTVKPFDDIRVRQAVAYSLDRERIVKQAFAGFGQASCLPWRPNAPGLTSADASYYTYDPAKAKALFKQAGSPSDTIPVVIGAGNTIAEAILNIVQFNLTAVGFKVKAQQVQATQYQTLLEDAKIPGLWVNAVGQVDLSVGTVLLGNAPFKITGNTSAVTAPEYTTLANKLIYASSDSEIAAAEQAVTKYILQQAWHMTVGHVPTVSARSPKLSGVGSTAGLALGLTDASLT